jgi:hypothetical protein
LNEIQSIGKYCLAFDQYNKIYLINYKGNLFEFSNEHQIKCLIPIDVVNDLVYFIIISNDGRFFLRCLNEEIKIGEGFPFGCSSNEFIVLPFVAEFKTFSKSKLIQQIQNKNSKELQDSMKSFLCQFNDQN